MRCKAARRAAFPPRTTTAIARIASPEQFYSGRIRVELPADHAGLLSTLHHEQRLPAEALAPFVDLSELLINQCCELRVGESHKSAWGIFKREGGVGFLRRVNTKTGERFGPCNPSRRAPGISFLDNRHAHHQPRGRRGHRQDAQSRSSRRTRCSRRPRVAHRGLRLNAEAGRQLGFLPGDVGDKMAPWARPIIDNMDFILRRLHGGARWTNPLADHQGDKTEKREAPPR